MKTATEPHRLNGGKISLCIHPGEAWCIFGSNTAGLDALFDAAASAPPSASPRIEVLSAAIQQKVFEDEQKKDDTNFLKKIDPGTPAAEFITNPEQHGDIIAAFNLGHCLEKGYRQLSTGESRKLLLLAAISRNPDILLLESPYDGVDRKGCRELDRIFSFLLNQGHLLVLTVTNKNDIPAWCTHLALVDEGEVRRQGPKETLAEALQEFCSKSALAFELACKDTAISREAPRELVRLRNGFARYGETEVFSGVNLEVSAGDHTLLTGPNGCGKSTLLHIICGDNQNCYANDLRIMGIQRGSGESIWELKKSMGILTPELHRNHSLSGSALEVVLSGLFDSIGVYTRFSSLQEKEALHWLEMIGLGKEAKRPFRSLCFAKQRLCLIARALIKLPPLLILDEPTQGLDQQSRNDLLDFLEKIAERQISTILYASHREDEHRAFFRQHLDLSAYSQTPPPA